MIWVKSDGTLKQVRCGFDFSKALKIYTLAVKQQKRAATLRSDNVGFPPPLKFADTMLVPIGRSKRTRKIVHKRVLIEPPQYQTKMRKLNIRGVFWCPYCIKPRKFTRRKGYYVDNVWCEDPRLCCPVCNISHRDGHVARFNPIAVELAFRQGRTRGKKRRRRRSTTDDE